jgi:NADP-dependent 3-hydroxy acid dehydrogenase YdfG
VLASRDSERLHLFQDSIESEGGRALAVPTDVTQRAHCEALIQITLDMFGKLDVLVNNAGVMPLSFVKNARVDEWEQMVDVNLKGVLYGTAAALPTFVAQRRGHIVNISSTAGRRVFVGGAVYCATKHAVTAFSEGLRLELGPAYGICVTCIEPGAVATELYRGIADEEFQRDAPPFKAAPIAPEVVADAVLFALMAPPSGTVNEVMVVPTDEA